MTPSGSRTDRNRPTCAWTARSRRSSISPGSAGRPCSVPRRSGRRSRRRCGPPTAPPATGAPGEGAVGDESAWEALRIEQGVPRFRHDFDESTYPQEASLEKRAVSFDKGCYLGQEVVCMLELRGQVKRKLVPVTLSASIPKGTPV